MMLTSFICHILTAHAPMLIFFIYRTDDADLLHLQHVFVHCACANAIYLFTEQMMLNFFICHMFGMLTAHALMLIFFLLTEQMMLTFFICHMFGMLTAHALMLIFFLFTEQMMLTFFICQMFGMFGAHASMLILFYLQNR